MVVVDDDGHARFGLGTAGLTPSKIRIALLLCQFRRRARADMIDELRTLFGELPLHLFITKPPVGDHFLKLGSDCFLGRSQRIHEELGVGADIFKKIPMNDEPVDVFSEQQGVSIFHFGSALSSYEDFRTCLVDAEDLVLIGDATLTDDAFVGLLDRLGEQRQDVIDATDDQSRLTGAEVGFEGPISEKKIAMGAGVTRRALGEEFEFTGHFLALGLAVFAPAGVAQQDDQLVEIVQEFVGTAFGHAVDDAVLSDAARGFGEGAAAVPELYPVDREVNVGAVTGGVIPHTEKVYGNFKSEQVDGVFKYGIVLLWSGGGLLEKHREGLIQNFRSEVAFGSVDGAFAGGEDLVEILDEAEPLFKGAVGEGDFEISNRSTAFVSAQDTDAKGAPGVLDELGQTSVEGFVVFSLLASVFKSCVEDELIHAALLEDFVDGFEFVTKFTIVGARPLWHDRNWTKWRSVAD